MEQLPTSLSFRCPRRLQLPAVHTVRADLLEFYIEVEYIGEESVWTEDRKAVFTDAADR